MGSAKMCIRDRRMITSLEPLTIKDYYAEEAESLFASVRALLGDTKLNIEMHYAVGSPAEEIVKEADLVDADVYKRQANFRAS